MTAVAASSLTSNLEEEGRSRSLSAMRRRQEKFKRSQMQETREKISREVTIPETITLQELAQRMTERSVDIIKYLMKQGQMMKPGDVIDADMAQLIAEEFGHTVKRVAESDVEEGIFGVADNEAALVSRPPVVTIMGHVDHGKTSLLDAIRHANVVSGEAGGITQHIGAYQVEQNGQKITFIDTPGHAAFTAMRARGAQATDIAILVVAADDSVMPQTIESINHAKAAGVPIIVAINKIDKPAADPQKVRTALLQHEVFVESMGGEVLDVEVSAKNKINLDKLLEAILLQAEILDLKSDPTRTAEGVVVEAQLDRGRGSVATVLVQTGTLHPGDILVAGSEWGRVRALVNDRGEHVKEAGPAMPVEILGLQGTPQAGDRFAVVANEAKAREIAEYRQRLARDKAVARQSGARGSLEQMMNQLQVSGTKEFPLVIKGDVQGSIEAITNALDKLGTDEVRARIVHSGAGGITESDVSLAEASNAAIIGFNVRANKQARDVQPISRASKSATTTSSMISSMTLRQRCRVFCRRSAAKPSLAMPRFSKSSTSPRSARSPVAVSPKARSSVVQASASFATTWLSTKASSRRSSASRTKCRKFRPVRSAAWRSRTTTTFAQATSSKPSASNTFRAHSDYCLAGLP